MHYNLPLVSADPVFDGIVTRLWRAVGRRHMGLNPA
jgi:hypothetical protein